MVRQNELKMPLLEGEIHVKKGKGKLRNTSKTSIKEWTGKTYSECVRAGKNRQESATANLLGADGTE